MCKNLEFLCWVNRCLFPDDFEKELVKLGMGKIEAFLMVDPYRHGKNLCIVEFYQEWCLGKDDTTKHIIDVWLEKYAATYRRLAAEQKEGEDHELQRIVI